MYKRNSEEIQTILLNNIKWLIKRNDKTCEELANHLDIDFSTLTAYENGDKLPDIDMLIKIAYIFDVSVDWLLGIHREE
ncbi:helix-turn-helix domain-containing protein [Chengkuizengella marina]|uniref:helix-turn-helix domain-containing protein n=1 Tax=Chengkuizengella marina TaxID=2507566 RepID=UPI00136DAC1C|nr:helix-turn-helix transcriptional regulator [Chengkuizengella marina]